MSPLLALSLLLSACQKKMVLAEEVSGLELVKDYQALARSPVSGSFQAKGAQGFFQGELYLEKGEKLQALILGYLTLGQPFFQLTLEDSSFLYLDLLNARAYSNQKDWLKDFETLSFFPNQTELIVLLRSLQALAGELSGSVEYPQAKGSFLKLRTKSDPEIEVEYLFRRKPLQLVELKEKGGVSFSAQFFYEPNCWFPHQIWVRTMNYAKPISREEFNLQINFSRLNCKEENKPEVSFRVPEGFSQIFIDLKPDGV